MRDFSPMASSAMEAAKNEIWHKGSLRDEGGAQTSNTRTAQRKRAIPHSMMKTNRNIIQCNDNTHQGVTYRQTNVRLRFGLR